MTKINIIGGNVAGLFTAIELHKKYPSFEITIYEQKKYWNKVCGGAFSYEFNDALEDLGILLTEAHEVDNFIFGSWNKPLNVHKSPLLVGNRLDLQEALSCHVEGVLKIPIINKAVSSDDTDLFTPTTIVATGASGFTRKTLRGTWGNKDAAMIVRFDDYINNSHLKYPNTALIAFDEEEVGYGWLFAGDNYHVNIGYGAVEMTNNQIWERFDKFITILNNVYGCKFTVEDRRNIMKFAQGWQLPMPVKKNFHVSHGKAISKRGTKFNDYITFVGVGDALGMAHPILGAGIEPAWLSAKLLAKNMSYSGYVNIRQYQKDIQHFARERITPSIDYHVCKFFRSSLYKHVPFKTKLINYLGGSHSRKIMKQFQEQPMFNFE